MRVAIWTGININWSKLVPVGCSWPTISRETLRLARAYARVFLNSGLRGRRGHAARAAKRTRADSGGSGSGAIQLTINH